MAVTVTTATAVHAARKGISQRAGASGAASTREGRGNTASVRTSAPHAMMSAGSALTDSGRMATTASADAAYAAMTALGQERHLAVATYASTNAASPTMPSSTPTAAREGRPMLQSQHEKDWAGDHWDSRDKAATTIY